MTSRLHIFDKFGSFITYIENVPVVREWVMSGYGRCTFAMPINDEKCTLINLQFGNFIYIEHVPVETDETKLIDWVGVILPDRDRNSNSIGVTAYSIEAMLAFRAMPYVTLDTIASEAFKKIIEFTNNSSTSSFAQFNIGNVSVNQVTYKDDLKTNAYDHIKKLVKFSRMAWNARCVIPPGTNKVSFYVDLYYNETTESGLILDNSNTEEKDPLYKEQGTIINDIYAITQSYTERDRQASNLKDEASINMYGPFQSNQVFIGQHDTASVDDLASNKISIGSKPSKTFSRTVSNKAIFSQLALNKVIRVKELGTASGEFSLDSVVRIIGMTYNDTTKKVELTVQGI